MSKTEHTMPLSEGENEQGIRVVGPKCGKSASKVAASTPGNDPAPVSPVRLHGMLGSYPLRQFLPGL